MPSLIGAHVIISSGNVDADRAFLRDSLGLESIDVGGGWLIFRLPPAEVAIHPGNNGQHQLYLMCADLDTTINELKGRGAMFKPDVRDQAWGRLTTLILPGGGELSLYQPRHASPPG